MEHINQKPEIIEVNTDRGIRLININMITYVEAENKQTKLVFKNSDTLKTNHLLKWFESKLNKDEFFRCHKSFIINFKYLDYVNRENVILNRNISIPLSRGKNKELKSKMALFVASLG